MNREPFVLLDPGDLIVTPKPLIIQTILGSCVAVTFYHPKTGFSGITHSLLPFDNNHTTDCEHCVTRCGIALSDKRFNYVTCSLHYLIKRFQQRDIPLKEIEVRLFGGAKPLSAISRDIGAENIKSARAVLSRSRIFLNSEDVGGVKGRVITFNTETGEVVVMTRKKK